MLPYGQLIKQAFGLVRGNRHLWFFGVFVGTSAPSFSFNVSGGTDSGGSSGDPGSLGSTEIVVIFVLLSVLVLIYALLYSVCQPALANSVAAIHRGEPRTFRSTLRAGTSRFWRMLGLGLLVSLAAVGVLFCIGLPIGLGIAGVLALTEALAVRVIAIGLLGLVGLSVVLVAFFLMAVVLQHSVRELGVRDRGPIAAFRGGWRVFRANMGQSLLLFLVQQGIVLGAGLVVSLVGLVIAIPAIAFALAADGFLAWAPAVGTGLVLIPLFLVAFGAIGAFSHSLWTLAYLRLAPA